VTSNQLYFKPEVAALGDAERQEALTVARDALAQVPGIQIVYEAAQMAGDCMQWQGLDRAVCHAIVVDESGELFIVPKRGWVITDYKNGTQHDAPNDDNRKVPIIVMGPGIAARATATGSQLQVAPTVAALLGVSPPARARAQPLFVAPARSPARP